MTLGLVPALRGLLDVTARVDVEGLVGRADGIEEGETCVAAINSSSHWVVSVSLRTERSLPVRELNIGEMF